MNFLTLLLTGPLCITLLFFSLCGFIHWRDNHNTETIVGALLFLFVGCGFGALGVNAALNIFGI